MSEVRLEREDTVATLTFSNPSKFNAMTMSMWRQLAQEMRNLDADEGVRAIVLQGDGEKAFCSGADLSDADYGRGEDAVRSEMNSAGEAAVSAIVQCSKPTIAKIRGVCMGGGLELAAACDLRICATDARFRMPAARLGLGYHAAGIKRYVQLMGPENTFDMFATARTFDGAEAVRLGYAGRISSPEELDTHARELAHAIASLAPLTLRAMKLAIRAASAEVSESSLSVAVEAAIKACLASEDLKEGMAAFQQKRKPRFQGR